MRVVNTERGYIDMDHVLAVGPSREDVQGLWGFDVILAFRDKAREYLWYPEDLGIERIRFKAETWMSQMEIWTGENKAKEIYKAAMIAAVEEKRQEFVRLWKGETLSNIPTISLWKGKELKDLSPEERRECFDEVTNLVKFGTLDPVEGIKTQDELRRLQKEAPCPKMKSGKHDFSSFGCPAGMQACLGCEEVEL